MTRRTKFTKDPQAVLDYNVDWSDWLADGETITSFTVTSQGSVTIDSTAESSGTVEAFVSGGDTKGESTLTFQITTSEGRTDERTLTLLVANR